MSKLWDKFLEERYQGGSKKVPNPNPETKDKFPEVALSTALKDPTTSTRVQQEYKDWLGRQQDEAPKKDQSSSGVSYDLAFAQTTGGTKETRMWSYARKHLIPNRKSLSSDGLKALTKYTGDGYAPINRYLRNPKEHGLSDKEVSFARDSIAQLDQAFESEAGELSTNLQVVRVVRSGPVVDLLESDSKRVVGAVLHDQGFLSTSISDPKDFSFAGGEYKIVINVPKGTRGIYVGPPDTISNIPEEMEFVLDRGSRLKVAKVDPDNKTLYATVMPRKATDKIKLPKLKKTPSEKVVKLKPAPKASKKYTPEEIRQLQGRKYSNIKDGLSSELIGFTKKNFSEVIIPERLSEWLNGFSSEDVQDALKKGEAPAELAQNLTSVDKLLEGSKALEDCELGGYDDRFGELLSKAKDGDIVEYSYLGLAVATIGKPASTNAKVRIPKGTKALNTLMPNGLTTPWSNSGVFLGANARFVVSHEDGHLIATALPD